MEGLERDNRYLVLQFPTDERIASVEEHFALRGVLECQVASPFHFHVVGAICGQVHMSLYGLVDVDGHGDVHAGKRHGWFPAFVHRYGIVEVHEFHHIAQSVGHHERRVLQYISEVGLAQYVHVPTHFQLVYRPLEGGIHIYIYLAIGGRLTVLRSVHQLIIVGLHAEVHHHLFHVGEVHGTIDGKRRIALGIDVELLEHHLAIDHVHHLVIEAETYREVGHRHAHRIELQASVQIGMHRITVYGEGTVHIARKFHHLLGDKRIEDRQWEMLQFQISGDGFVPYRIGLVDAVHIDDFPVVVRQESVHMMPATIARQVDTAHFPIAHRTLFVHEIIHTHIGTEHHLTFGIHIVQRTAQPSVHIGHIRNHLAELL